MISKLSTVIAEDKEQYLVYLLISIIIGGFTGILSFYNPTVFQWFIGNLNPLLTIVLLTIVGFGFLVFQKTRGWFEIFKRENVRGLLRLAILTVPSAVAAILVDLYYNFPEDMNVLFPDSLLYYTTIDFALQILFHLIPITLLMIVAKAIVDDEKYQKVLWICIFIVALIEPSLQMIWAQGDNDPLWVIAFTGLNVLAINLLELYAFKRYDFVSMYSIRLVYYMFWHIIWGYLRLVVLF